MAKKTKTRTSFVTKINVLAVDIDGKAAEVQELSGQVMSDYMAGMAARMKMDAAGKPVGLTDMRGIQSSLIYLCLRLDGAPVPIQDIEKWPSSMVKDLHALCQEVNGMGDAEGEELKNE